MNKSKSAVVRMSPETYADLCERAKAQGLTFSAYLRKIIHLQAPHLPIWEDVRAIFDEANRHVTTTATGRIVVDPGEYAKYEAAAIQRIQEGIRELKAGEPEVARIPEQWRQAITALEEVSRKLQTDLTTSLMVAEELMGLLKSAGYPGGRHECDHDA